MLNYIWAGLIVSSFLFALGYDIRDINGDRYRNGAALPVTLAFPQGYDPAARRVPVEIRVDSAEYARYTAEIERFDQLVSPEVIAHWIDTFEATLGEAYRHDPILAQESLHDQAESLKQRAERQHDAIAGQ